MMFDYLEVSGSHEEVGFSIGKRFKTNIQKSIKSKQLRIKKYSEYLRRSEPYFKATAESFPDLIKEIKGISMGAHVELHDYFMNNCREVFLNDDSDHCTIAVNFDGSGAIVGHNEDWVGASPEVLYILKASVGNTTFFGLQYKVVIPGVSAAINNWKLVQCVNDLNQKSRVGVPKNFVARAVLECKNLDEAERLIKNTKRASGFNHVLVQGKEVRNIEIAGDFLSVQKLVGRPYVHTNHYLSPELIKFETRRTENSLERYSKASQLIESANSVSGIEKLLSDDSNKNFPILRNDATLGSIIFCPEKDKAFISYGTESEYKEYNL